MKRLFSSVVLAAALAGTWMPAYAVPFDINVSFGGGLTATQQAVFTTAEAIWEGRLPEYQAGITVASLDIVADARAIDDVGGTLGQAGPTMGVFQGSNPNNPNNPKDPNNPNNPNDPNDPNNPYLIATAGVMSFDSADITALEGGGTLLDVILHEMAHVMGFGTLWTDNDVYATGSGEFTGANALAAYQAEFIGTGGAIFVPVELGFGPGTANAHWDESDFAPNNSGETNGELELMTGFLNSPTYISNTTIQSFVDIGYLSAAVTLVPEPSTVVLMMLGVTIMFAVRRRRRTA